MYCISSTLALKGSQQAARLCAAQCCYDLPCAICLLNVQVRTSSPHCSVLSVIVSAETLYGVDTVLQVACMLAAFSYSICLSLYIDFRTVIHMYGPPLTPSPPAHLPPLPSLIWCLPTAQTVATMPGTCLKQTPVCCYHSTEKLVSVNDPYLLPPSQRNRTTGK